MGSLDSAPQTFLAVLERLGDRPPADAPRATKRDFAERLSNVTAVWIAHLLRGRGIFPGVLPNADGSGRESRVASGASKKPKKTDVRFGTIDTGLELLVSLKSIGFRDEQTRRYTKNMVRNDHELRAEAMDLHNRFPYAVLAAVLLLPVDSCVDGATEKSSFGHAVMTFRGRAGRVEATDPSERFERMFIGLYQHDGPNRGSIGFFDVASTPPKRGLPKSHLLLSPEQFIEELVRAYGIRNGRYMEWADDAPELTDPKEDHATP